MIKKDVGKESCEREKWSEEGVFLVLFITAISLLILITSYAGKRVSAAQLPSADTVYESYKNNPYLRFYEGDEGIAWTTIHPGGYSVTSHGTYIYGGGRDLYRGTYGTEVIPEGVLSVKELQGPLPDGHHYYAAPVTNEVIPVGKWVLSHMDSRCVHGPFSACRDYEYYGIGGISNVKCGKPYDSGWIAYCADCGEELTGFVYASDDCVSRIGYIYAGDDDFRKQYPVEYLFICPICGDNLENDFSISVHNCKRFVSANRYSISYDGNGATRGSLEPSTCYFGGAEEYEGKTVNGETNLRENAFVRPGYIFRGWSDSPDGQVIFSEKDLTSSVENYYTVLSGSGDDANDTEITLYAVWERSDCILNVSGGSFGDSNGYYDGVENGFYAEDKNSFNKGHMHETVVDPSALTGPDGYKVSLMGPGGELLREVYAQTILSGWRFESSDPDAHEAECDSYGAIKVSGKFSGDVTSVSSSGTFIYIHSSPLEGNTDEAIAEWRSSSLILPECNLPGHVFIGWYSEPDLNPGSYVGGKGDIFIPASDTVLYGAFSDFNLTVTPDYMGSEKFGDVRFNGLTGVRIPGISGYDVFKYFISSEADDKWEEAMSDIHTTYESAAVRTYSGNGEYYEYVAPVAGVYSFELWGGAGASYAGYSGENGEYSSFKIFLDKGDVAGIYTGFTGEAVKEEGLIRCYGGEGSYITINGDMIVSTAGGDGATFVLNVSEEFEYTGSVQSFTAETDGIYTLEVWGAAGAPTREGRNTAGSGGYSRGNISLTSGDILYICVGGRNGYNGGGGGGCDAYGGAGGNGGGATHIAFSDGQLRSLSGKRDTVCIVAGGGGGAGGSMASSGNGGGESGGPGRSPWPGGEGYAAGGNQRYGGEGAGFGYGAGGLSYRPKSDISAMINNGGGGGGWYGGAGGTVTRLSYGCGGGGGSGYIGGVTEGEMRTGGRGGNGLARISVSVNIYGSDSTGEGTTFNPGSFPYSDYQVKDHESCDYPQEDALKCGYCIITEPDEDYYNDSDTVICSPDNASPQSVSNAYLTYDADSGYVNVIWNMPDDNGTDYRYMAGAYRMRDIMSGDESCVLTDVKELNIKTGVYSYHYLIDSYPDADAADVKSNGMFMLSPWSDISGSAPDAYFDEWYAETPVSDKRNTVSFLPDGTDKYIHIIATDRAGNDSTVFTMAVDGDGAFIPYPIVTDELTITESSNVYRDSSREETYYVRADGNSVFSIDYSAHLTGYARSSYQPDVARLHLSGSEYAEYRFERNENVMTDCDAYLTDTTVFGPFPLGTNGISGASRTERSTVLSFTGRYTVSAEGEMYIYPSAHARFESSDDFYCLEDGMVSSNRSDDLSHGLTLIGDNTAPECYVSVNGGEYARLRECDISNVSASYVVDRRFDAVNIDLYVKDAGAGLKDGFEVSIKNLDNGLEAVYQSAQEHYGLELKIDESSEESVFENMLFNGRFVIRVSSEDNVGNYGTEESAGLTELDVNGEIVRVLDTITGTLVDEDGRHYIKKGESGYVVSKVWGYPDAVLVSFGDPELSGYDVLYVTGSAIPGALSGFEGTVIYIDRPEYYLEMETTFTVPLEYEGGEIEVTITAYKGDECITWEAECAVLSSGSVLDELMTVLR